MTAPRATMPGGPRSRGSIYAMVLATVSCAVAIVLGGLELSQLGVRRAGLLGDSASATCLARSAVEEAVTLITADANWRKTYTRGVVCARSLGNGRAEARVIDPVDGVIDTGDYDDVLLWGVGAQGDAKRTVEVTLRPTDRPMTCLKSALHAASDITITGVITTDGPITSETKAIATGARVAGDVTAPSVSGSVYLRSTTTAKPSYTMPTVAVVSTWAARGTSISRAQLTSNTLSNVILSSTSNPFGAADPNGVYVIDCQGQSITITNVIVIGTLVLKDAGKNTTVTGAAVIKAPTGQPALLVDGAMDLDITSASVNATAIQTKMGLSNLLGVVGAILTGNPTSTIEGPVYVSAELTLRGITPVVGTVITGSTAAVSGTVKVRYDPTVLDHPPAGMAEAIDMRIVPGSWKTITE